MAILSTFAPYEMVIKLAVLLLDFKNNYGRATVIKVA